MSETNESPSNVFRFSVSVKFARAACLLAFMALIFGVAIVTKSPGALFALLLVNWVADVIERLL